MKLNWKRVVYGLDNPLIVEVEGPTNLPEMSPDLNQQVLSLQYHPGFKYLLDKLKVQRSLLQSTLVKQRQATMTDVEFLKSGIAWTAWLEEQLRQATGFGKRTSVPLPAADAELAAFKEAMANLEIVGQ